MRARKVIYLAHRRSKPMTGWWWIGGKMVPDQTLELSAVKNFQRETGLELPVSRLQLVGFLDYRWKDRAQAPQDMGCHMMGITFVVELTEAELLSVAANLDPKEYQKSVGLVPFNRHQLVEENVAPPILKLYDHVFSNR
ncbi:MAG: NUDIX hydrolase [Patescibacteria group bacterium]